MILVGIGIAFGGTWLIQDSQPQHRRKEKLPLLPKNPHEGHPLHGGLSTGPKTPEGKACSALNGRKGGRPKNQTP
jgi:hypothetical protein